MGSIHFWQRLLIFSRSTANDLWAEIVQRIGVMLDRTGALNRGGPRMG